MVISPETVLTLLHEVKDPELLILDVVELGIVRAVDTTSGHVCIDITPTYTGCPALKMIEGDIISTLAAHHISSVTVRIVYSPAWTTDWLSVETKEKLREAGISPPNPVQQEPLVILERAYHSVVCPFCGSSNTEERSE